MLRAGPFSDERIIALINRRFVPFYFDLSSRGFAGDAAARDFVVKAKPSYGGRAVSTPRVLFMTPDGKVVAEENNYATEAQFLATLRKLMRDQPGFMKPGKVEAERTSPEDKAQVAIDLLDSAGARKLLKGVESDRAHFMLGRLDRKAERWTPMKEHFAKVKDKDYRSGIRIEMAYERWADGEFRALLKALQEFPADNKRYTEARYLEGLALFHLGKKDEARAVWKSTIDGCAQDPWIYRADWAYCASKGRSSGLMSSAGPRTSLLNRIGYMGRANPDLAKR